MRRRAVLALSVPIVALVTALLMQGKSTPAQPPTEKPRSETEPAARLPRPPVPPLPIAQVILFNSGVGYFQREGEVQDCARIDLAFPAAEVNDLLKSLVLQDLGDGQVRAISYDSPDPVEKTLKSFALDLTANPTFGELLNQARGEAIEVTLRPGSDLGPGPLQGSIVGMEAQVKQTTSGMVESHSLNLLCAEGMRAVPLSQVQRVRFLNAALDRELRRALEVLASTHDMQKKLVSLTFDGHGKRKVRVGYVVENPIWKTSYRLVLDRNGALLQGWAMVENTSDEDWVNVRMVLVSGRPISFQMDLYPPLYVPRPIVEPERFASLRPPAYSGPLADDQLAGDPGIRGLGMMGMGGMPGPGADGRDCPGTENLGNGGGMLGMMGAHGFGIPNRYQLGRCFGQIGGGFGQVGGNLGGQAGNPRLTFEQMRQRRQQAKDQAGKVGSRLTALDPSQGVAAAASTEEVGDAFQYVIDHPVSLSRQKSALLPIVDQRVQVSRVSIFNESVHPGHPLRGLRFKNTSGLHLMQGPVTIYDGGSYAGDARVLDLQPGEERLLSYAVDLGTEIKSEEETAPQQLTAVKIAKGVVYATHKLRTTRTYLVKNRSAHDRTVLIEHPYRGDWKLVSPAHAQERSRDVYRFALEVPAGKSARLPVVEEQTGRNLTALREADDRTVQFFLASTITSPRLKEALQKAVAFRSQLAEIQSERSHLEEQLRDIKEDQTRLRANLREVPADSAAHRRYLAKFDAQEPEIEKLQSQIKQQQRAEQQKRQEYETYLAGLTIE